VISNFYLRDAMLARVLAVVACVCLGVCVSVCLSHADIVPPFGRLRGYVHGSFVARWKVCVRLRISAN